MHQEAETDTSVLIVPERKPKKCSVSCRQILAFMAFLGFVNIYCLRVNLSVALVAMVNSSYLEHPTANGSECPGEFDNHTHGNSTHYSGEFPWDSTFQGLVLGSFFYGYIITQIPGGWFAENFGGKRLFGFGVLCTALLTLLTPVVARLDKYLFVALRILEGIGEGVTFPAMHAILAQWAPPLERSQLVTFIYAGAQMGTVVASPVSGLLCEYGFAGGWPSVFYVFGTIGCVWFLLWMFLCYDSPASHPWISTEEREFIEKAIGNANRKRPPTPWRSIFSSLPVWAIIVAHVTSNWGFYTLLTCLPKYMREVLQFDISENGFLSGLPYLVTWLLMASGGAIADILRKCHVLSTTAVRKLYNTVGQILPAIFLIATGYLGCDRVLAVVMVTLAVGTSGLAMTGYGVNHLDVAPPFAGTLLGVTNAAATIPGFVGPQVVGVLTQDNPSREQWQIVFFIAAGIYAFGSVFYLVFGTGVEQEWARSPYEAVQTTDIHINGSTTEDEELLSDSDQDR